MPLMQHTLFQHRRGLFVVGIFLCGLDGVSSKRITINSHDVYDDKLRSANGSDQSASTRLCSTPECKSSAEWLRGFLNTDIDPCTDFSAFTCSPQKKRELPKPLKSETMLAVGAASTLMKKTVGHLFNDSIPPGDVIGQTLAPLIESVRLHLTLCKEQTKDPSSEKGLHDARAYLARMDESSPETMIADSHVVHTTLQPEGRLGLIHINPLFAFMVHPNMQSPSKGEQMLLLLKPCPEVTRAMSVAFKVAEAATTTELIDMGFGEFSKFSYYSAWASEAGQDTCRDILINEVIKGNLEARYPARTSAELQQRAAAAVLKPTFSFNILEVPKILGGAEWQHVHVIGDLAEVDKWAKGVAAMEAAGITLPSLARFARFSNFAYRVSKSPSPALARATCKSKVSSMFGWLVGRMYVPHVLTGDTRSMVADIFQELLLAFESSAKSLSWISEGTLQKALEKASALKAITGYPDWIMNDAAMTAFYAHVLGTTANDNWIELSLRHEAADVKHTLSRGHQPRDVVSDPFFPPTKYNLGYLPTANVVYNYAAFMNEPNFVPSGPLSFTFGFLGMFMAHEITHGFDAKGAERDKNGDMMNWWSEGSRKHFETAKSCFIRQYSSWALIGDDPEGMPETTDSDGRTVEPVRDDGAKCIAENIADSGGLNLAFLAYKQWSSKFGAEPRLEGLEQYSPEQLFFLRFGAGFCNSQTTKQLHNQITGTDPHATNRMRVVGAIQNSRAFGEVFGCPADTSMNPVGKCEIWG